MKKRESFIFYYILIYYKLKVNFLTCCGSFRTNWRHTFHWAPNCKTSCQYPTTHLIFQYIWKQAWKKVEVSSSDAHRHVSLTSSLWSLTCGIQCCALPVCQVSASVALQWCEEIGAEYFEGSAKEDVDVEKTFLRAARLGLQQVSIFILWFVF